jgi:hypothetical protein
VNARQASPEVDFLARIAEAEALHALLIHEPVLAVDCELKSPELDLDVIWAMPA